MPMVACFPSLEITIVSIRPEKTVIESMTAPVSALSVPKRTAAVLPW